MAEPAAAASSDAPSSKPASTSYSDDPALYIYTSLTAGSSHIVTATSRLETILRANKVPFKAIDLATDDKARSLWGRRAGKDAGGRVRKLPGLVQMGLVLGDLVEIEDWNEYGELKQHVTMYYDEFTQPSISEAPKPKKKKKAAPAPEAPPLPPAESGKAEKENEKKETPKPVAAAALPIRALAEEAAAKAKQIRLQSLRDKAYGKGNTGPPGEGGKAAAAAAEGTKSAKPEEEKEKDGEKTEADTTAAAEEKDDDDDEEDEEGSKSSAAASTKKAPAAISVPPSSPPPTKAATTSSTTTAGLQSPTSGAWRGISAGENGDDADDAFQLRTTIQSPTSTRWRFENPTDVDPPLTSYRGSLISRASQEEIAQIEREQAIPEQPEEEEEAEEEEEEREKEKERERRRSLSVVGKTE